MDESNPHPHEAIIALKQVTTGMVVDALAMMGIQGGVRGIRPIHGFEEAKIVAPAATVRFGPPEPGAQKLNMYRAIRSSSPGAVLVVDAKGVDSNFTGDNQGEFAQRHGLVGVIVYGGARDLSGYRRLGMPLYCTGSATADEPGDLCLRDYNVPIEIGGVRVSPGDMIVADEDGVVAVPSEALAAVLHNLKIVAEVEAEMERAIQTDASVEEVTAILSKKKRRTG